MKTKVFIVWLALLFSAAAFAQEVKTMYIMKNSHVVFSAAVSDIDSIIFYKPVYDPLSDGGVIINGVKWATRNVAAPGTFADSPDEAGMFYQWNRKVGWSATDPMVNSNGGTSWDDSTPSGTSWESANDPSPAGWRVPAFNEIQTLLDGNKVSCEWITVNGVTGVRFTDKATGNSIFLPAAGYRLYYDGTLSNVGYGSYYWSSTQYDSLSDYSYRLVSSGNDYADWAYVPNRYGFSVRPVAE